MDELKTLLGTDIPLDTRGIVYLSEYIRSPLKLKIVQEIFFESSFDAITAYSNIPNPESQVVMGKTFDKLIEENEQLKRKIIDPEWLLQLGDNL